MHFPTFYIPHLVLSAILSVSTSASSAAPPDPPAPPKVTPDSPPAWNPAKKEWTWRLNVLGDGIASFHVDAKVSDPKAQAFQSEPAFVFEADPGDLLGGGGIGYFWQVAGKTPSANKASPDGSPFSFSVLSGGFTGAETFTYRYDYLWQYDEDGTTKVVRTVFNIDAAGNPVILQNLPVPVPEPASAVLLMAGLAALGFAARRRHA